MGYPTRPSDGGCGDRSHDAEYRWRWETTQRAASSHHESIPFPWSLAFDPLIPLDDPFSNQAALYNRARGIMLPQTTSARAPSTRLTRSLPSSAASRRELRLIWKRAGGGRSF